MDEAWERAVEAALEGQAVGSSSAPRTLTLDGAVKCLHGRLPPPGLLERFQTLEHLSITNVGVSSLEKFPRLRNLQRLILSDNRIAGGLEFLVEAGLDSLRDLDLSNNRIQFLEDLAPLARLRLVSLDLYECPVTRVSDYRSKVFAMIRSLKYLDKMDAEEIERPESDDEEDEDDEEDDEEEEDDPGSGEIDGEDRTGKVANGVLGGTLADGVVDVDEDDESDADEEESVRAGVNGSVRVSHHHLSNGFRVAAVGEEDEEEEDVEEDDIDDDDDDEEDPGEEIDEEDGEEEDVVEVHDIGDSDEDGDGVEEEDVDVEEEDDDELDGDGDGDEDEEDVEDEEEDGEPGSTARMTSTDGEIDGHEQGEEDENGEIGEEEQGVEAEPDFEDDGEGEDEEEDLGGDYLVQQHIPQAEVEAGGSDSDACNGEDEDGVDDDDDDAEDCLNNGTPSSPQPSKRKRGGSNDVDDDCVDDLRSSKHR